MTKSKNQQQEEEFEAQISIHGDILDSILSRVPLLYLLPASYVSKSWNQAVFSSLHFNTPKPWLLVHTQGIWSPHATSTHAYDPRSDLWIEINQSQPSINQIESLRSSHSTLLYMLSLDKLIFSIDPLHLTWHEVDAPRLSRLDPIVALVGTKVVIGGDTCDINDDPLAVEMYDLETRTWDTCPSMPEILFDCASFWWLSTAVCDNKMYVLEKRSGVVHCFDPVLKVWSGPYDFNPGKRIHQLEIECVNDRLIIVGLTNDPSDHEKVIIWEMRIDGENRKLLFKEIGEMPKEMVKKLKGESDRMTSVKVNMMGNFLYIHNPDALGEVILCEMAGNGDSDRACDGEWKWRSIRNIVVNDRTRFMDSFVFSCGNVGPGELQRSSSMYENLRLNVKS